MLKLTAAVLGLAITAAPAAPQTPPTGARFALSGNMLPQKKSGEPREIVDRLFAAYRARDVDGIAGLMAADVVFEDPLFRQRRAGRDGIRSLAAEMRTALSDVTIDVHSMVVAGEWVATEQTLGGILTRPDGVKRPIKVRGSSFFQIRDGQIHTWTDYFDYRTFTEQTGHGM
jgi:steroid delta-isomerase-like uncharacterized protein